MEIINETLICCIISAISILTMTVLFYNKKTKKIIHSHPPKDQKWVDKRREDKNIEHPRKDASHPPIFSSQHPIYNKYNFYQMNDEVV